MSKGLDYFDVIISVTGHADREKRKTYQVFTLGSGARNAKEVLRVDLRNWCLEANKNELGLTYRLEQLERSGELDSVITRLTSQGLVECGNSTIRL